MLQSHEDAAKHMVPSHPGWWPHSTLAPTHPLSENSRCARCGAPSPLFGALPWQLPPPPPPLLSQSSSVG